MEPDKFRMSREEYDDEMTRQPCTCRTPPRSFIGTWDTTPAAHEPGCAWRRQEERMAARKRERVDRAIESLNGEVAAHEGDIDPDFAPQVDGSTGEMTSDLPGQADRAAGEVEGQGEAARPIQNSSQLGGLGVGREGVHEGADHHEQEGQDDGSHAPGGDAESVPGGSNRITCDPPRSDEPRFGERLRAEMGLREGWWLTPHACERLAAAIDRDATIVLAAYHDKLLEIYEGIARQRLEQLVEELRHAALFTGIANETRTVVDAETLLGRLPGIFGHSDEPEPATDPEGRLLT